jgi:hypothetical protein
MSLMEYLLNQTNVRSASETVALAFLISGLLLSGNSVVAIAGSGHPDGSHSGVTLFLLHDAAPENRDDADEMENDTLYVIELLLARDVVEREPVDVVEYYTTDDSRAWCFARIHNSQRMQNVYFEWYHEGELHFEMNTRVGKSTNWRTYSSVGLRAGQWRVLIRDRHGAILAERTFEVTG